VDEGCPWRENNVSVPVSRVRNQLNFHGSRLPAGRQGRPPGMGQLEFCSPDSLLGSGFYGLPAANSIKTRAGIASTFSSLRGKQ
jgi:hypothetical protein